MKNLVFAAVAAILAGCSTCSKSFVDSSKPDPEATAKPTYAAISDYRAKHGGYAIMEMESPRAAVWQEKNRAAIDAATSPAALDAFLASPAAADAMCAEVKPGYKGDPLKLTQIAAASVYVMDKGNCAKRKIWVAALEKAKAASKTNDVDAFFAQQLLVCGY